MTSENTERVYYYINTSTEPALSTSEMRSKALLDETNRRLAEEVGEGTVTLHFDPARGMYGATIIVVKSARVDEHSEPVMSYARMCHTQDDREWSRDAGKAIDDVVADFARKLRDLL